MTGQVRIPSEKFSSEAKRYDLVDLPFLARTSRWAVWAAILVYLMLAIFMISATTMKFSDLHAGDIAISSQDMVFGSFGILLGIAVGWFAVFLIDMALRQPVLILTDQGFNDSRCRTSADWRSVVSAVPFGSWYFVRGIHLRFEEPVEMVVPFGIGRFGLLWTLRKRNIAIFTIGLDQSSSLVEKIILELISRSFDADTRASGDHERPASPSITSPASVVVQA